MGLWDYYGTMGLWDYGTMGLWDYGTMGLRGKTTINHSSSICIVMFIFPSLPIIPSFVRLTFCRSRRAIPPTIILANMMKSTIH